jgi:hypothetical protein
MNNLPLKNVFLFILLLTLTIRSGDAQIFHRNPDKQLFGKTPGIKKESKVKGPRSALKAKRKQEANDRRLEKDYEKAIKRSQKRTIEIQSPEVKARMRQNKKDFSKRDRQKAKKIRASTKGAGKKYK